MGNTRHSGTEMHYSKIILLTFTLHLQTVCKSHYFELKVAPRKSGFCTISLTQRNTLTHKCEAISSNQVSEEKTLRGNISITVLSIFLSAFVRDLGII